ncbi:MAG TPA: hypothetical protein VMT62_01295 [Syntrophorhabdaceae bacterium]|nr:hypothetical protein [Syntrophorhabdaceae bacterium]
MGTITKTLRKSKSTLLILCMLAFFPGTYLCADEPSPKEPKQQGNPCAGAEITIQIISPVNNAFRYGILIYDPLVHELGVYGRPGNEGFAAQERPQTATELVSRRSETTGCFPM